MSELFERWVPELEDIILYNQKMQGLRSQLDATINAWRREYAPRVEIINDLIAILEQHREL